MNLRRKVVKGIAWSAAQSWGSRAISYMVFLLLARLLDPAAFGLVAMASVFIAFADIFVDQGFSEAIVQRAKLERAHLDTAFWASLLTGLILLFVGVVVSTLVADLYEEPSLAPIVSWLSLSFLFSALSSTQRAILKRNLSFKSLAVRTLLAAILGGVTGLSMALLGAGVWSLVGQNLVTSLVGTLVLWQVSDWRPGFSISKRHFQELFVFGLHMVGAKFLNFFNRRADDFLIGYFLGPIVLGYYIVAYRLILVMTRLLTGVTQTVAFPTFSRLQNEPERIRHAFYTVTQLTSLISFPVFLGVAVTAPELVFVLYGPQWDASVPVMQILAFIGILQSVFYFNSSVIMAAGKPSWHLGITLLNAIFNIITFAVVVRFGIIAIAAAYVIGGYLLSPLPLLAVRNLIQIKFSTYLRQYLVPLFGSVVMSLAILGLKFLIGTAINLYLQLTIYVIMGALIYIVFVQLTAASLSRQLFEIFSLILPERLKLKRT